MTALPNPQAFQNAQPLTYAKPAAGRDMAALVRKYTPTVKRLAWHVHGAMSTAVEIEDLVQIGMIACVEAANSFEDRGEASFDGYLVMRVRGAMIDELRRQAAMTRGAMKRRKAYHQTVDQLTNETGKKPDDAAIAARLGVSVEKMRTDYATAEAVRFDSIDEVYADDAPWFASEDPSAFDALADGQLREVLIRAIGSLPEREAQVVQLYYVEELNLEEIGQVFGIGAARVCQIKASAHEKLKKALRSAV